jgi:kynurenine formamidase
VFVNDCISELETIVADSDPSAPIQRADFEAWEVRSGVKIGPGEIPLLYTGRWKRRGAVGSWSTQVAGYYPDTIPWIHDRLPSFIGHDFNIDWNPRPGWEGMRNPIHIAVLNWMGINIVECLDLAPGSPEGIVSLGVV